MGGVKFKSGKPVNNIMPETVQSSIDDQAAAWVVCLRNDNISEAQIADFADWLSLDQSHVDAWRRALDDWQTLAVTAAMPLAELEEDCRQPVVRRIFASGLAPWLALAASLLLVVAGGFGLFTQQQSSKPYVADVQQSVQQLHHRSWPLDSQSGLAITDNSFINAAYANNAFVECDLYARESH